MTALLAALLLLFAPLQDVTTCAAATVTTDDAGPVVVQVVSGTDAPGVVSAVRTYAITTSDEPTGKRPNAWIGVRVTPIPAPLAAHIGDHGVLIANIVCDGPADAAGMERYDVLVRFGDRDIDAPADLTAAIGAVKPGTPVKVGVIRGGKPQELRLQPAPRPRDVHYELKYDEPEDQALSRSIELRGKTLQLNPNGQWIISDLGTLQGLPDVLAQVPFSTGLFGDPNDMDIELRLFGAFDPNNPPPNGYVIPDDQHDDNISVQVQVSTDGKSLSVSRAADGTIHVTHTGADGIVSEGEYANTAQLEEADPEAAELLESQVRTQGPLGLRVRRVKPHGAEMEMWQNQFQEEIERRVKEALSRSHAARARATPRVWQAVPQAAAGGTSAHDGDQDLLGARAYPDGRIRVFVRGAGGEVEQLEFVDDAAFEAAAPELYQRYHELFGD